jgi:hypothetical protein
MSGMPPFKCPSNNNFTLGPLAPFSKIWNPANGTQPTLDQQPLTWPQIVAIFTRVAIWQVTGTISYAGTPAVPDDVFDSDAVTTTEFEVGGDDVTSYELEPWIPSGKLVQIMNWTDPTTFASAQMALTLGCPFNGYDGSVSALGSILLDDTNNNNLYIADENIGGALAFNFAGTIASGTYYGYSNGRGKSDILCTILGVPVDLYGGTEGGYTASGTIALTAKQWFAYNGVYNTATGARL